MDQNTTTLGKAYDYLERGWHPIRIPLRSKKANYQWDKRQKPKDYEGLYCHFSDESNIGVILGKASNYLVDIDIDSEEILLIAQDFLPGTNAIFGRNKKPKSHYLYYCEEATTEQFQADEMIIEIRSDGTYTIFPGSIHESGDYVSWDFDGLPSKVSYSELRKGVAKLASIKLLSKYWSDKSHKRHSIALALAGALARRGWLETEAIAFVKAICQIANDSEMNDRINCVADTFTKYKDDFAITGLTRLNELIHKSDCQKLDKWLGLSSVAEKPQKETSANVVSLVEKSIIELFQTSEKDVYAKIMVNDHCETVNLESKDFKHWVENLWYSTTKNPLNKAVCEQVLELYRAKARYDETSKEKEVFVRVASNNGNIYLDLSNDKWEVVKITSKGWNIIPYSECPIMFHRPHGMLPLNAPEKGGNIADLRNYINVTDKSFPLVLGWLLYSLNPEGAKPILVVNGEQGSAKTTTCSFLKTLIDANKAEIAAPPKDEDTMLIAAQHTWICNYDNLSFVKHDLSDSLCRLSTGAGFPRRTLYTTAEQTIIKVKRPVIVNGITDFLKNADVLDRSVFIECPTILPEKRRTDSEAIDSFEKARPKLLGALLDAVSVALRELPNVKTTELARMADFHKFVIAGETGLGLPKGEFDRIYLENRKQAHAITQENNPLIDLIVSFMSNRPQWKGTASELHTALGSHWNPQHGSKIPIPEKAQTLGAKLDRLKPSLRASGVDCDKHKSGKRIITFTRIEAAAGGISIFV